LAKAQMEIKLIHRGQMNINHLLRLYEKGLRDFSGLKLNGANLSHVSLIQINLTAADKAGSQSLPFFLH